MKGSRKTRRKSIVVGNLSIDAVIFRKYLKKGVSYALLYWPGRQSITLCVTKQSKGKVPADIEELFMIRDVSSENARRLTEELGIGRLDMHTFVFGRKTKKKERT